MVGAVAAAIPALLILAARVGTEQYAAGLERRAQFGQHARQFATRDVEQRCVGVDAVEMRCRQSELEKILLPHLAAALGARHGHELRGALQADGTVTEPGKCP
jgi:hypothetical protein